MQYYFFKIDGILVRYFLEMYPQITPSKISVQSTFSEFIQNSQQILDIFLINSYALVMSISESSPSSITSIATGSAPKYCCQVIVRLPANLWSQQVLMKRGDKPINNFEIKVLKILAERSGFKLFSSSTTFANQIDVFHSLAFTKDIA